MQFRRPNRKNIPAAVNYKQNRLSFYKSPPIEEITLEEFEQLAVDRLKMLREIENINIRFKKNSDEYHKKMKDVVNQLFSHDYEEQKLEDLHQKIGNEKSFVNRTDEKERDVKKNIERIQNKRKKENISHFILRLAFARSEDLRRWFLSQEVELFRYRFQEETTEQRQNFLKENNLNTFDSVDDEEKKVVMNSLKETMGSYRIKMPESIQIEQTLYYKVPFTDVLDLVKNRKVFLKKGFAYVPEEELVSIILGYYRTQLSQELAEKGTSQDVDVKNQRTARKLPYLEEDTRLLPMLKNLRKKLLHKTSMSKISSAYIGDSYASKKVNNDEKLSLSEIDQSSKISFPICMRNLHDGLRKDHHLKHFGRLQYGLFLKACGLSLEEAMIFWRTEFTQKMDVDKFEKGYAYNIRHSYGKEGKRADYTPYSCLRIITTNQPGPGDFHGCPFKHSDNDMLVKRLQSYKVQKENINEIVDLVSRQHFQVACARYFEVTHKVPENTVSINHPNEYFHESRRILKGGSTTKTSSSNPVKTEVKKETAVKKDTTSTTNTNTTDVLDINMDDDMPMI